MFLHVRVLGKVSIRACHRLALTHLKVHVAAVNSHVYIAWCFLFRARQSSSTTAKTHAIALCRAARPSCLRVVACLNSARSTLLTNLTSKSGVRCRSITFSGSPPSEVSAGEAVRAPALHCIMCGLLVWIDDAAAHCKGGVLSLAARRNFAANSVPFFV